MIVCAGSRWSSGRWVPSVDAWEIIALGFEILVLFADIIVGFGVILIPDICN